MTINKLHLCDEDSTLVAEREECSGCEPALLFDANRMANALRAETIHVPEGLDREELRQFIISHAEA
jgi:hypothetical protein